MRYKKNYRMGRLPVMSGRGVSLIVSAVFLPAVKFTSVVTQTAKILTPKNVLAARLQTLPNGAMTSKREAVSRTVQQIFRLTSPNHSGFIDASISSNAEACRDGRRRLFSFSEDR